MTQNFCFFLELLFIYRLIKKPHIRILLCIKRLSVNIHGVSTPFLCKWRLQFDAQRMRCCGGAGFHFLLKTKYLLMREFEKGTRRNVTSSLRRNGSCCRSRARGSATKYFVWPTANVRNLHSVTLPDGGQCIRHQTWDSRCVWR